jgi:hypothetical protein
MLDDLRSALQRLDRQDLKRQDLKRQGPKRKAPEPRPGSNDETQSET